MLLDIVRYAFKALTEKKFRAILTIIGIAIGPLALVMMTSVVRGYSDYVQQQLTTLGQNTIVVFAQSGYTLTQNDLDYIRSQEEVEDAKPFFSTQGYIQRRDGRINVYVYAIDPDVIFEAIGGLEIIDGEAPSDNEITYSLVGYYIAHSQVTKEQIYEVGDAITVQIPEVVEAGQIRINRVTVRIKGIMSEYGGAFFISPDITIVLPFEAGRRLLGMKDWTGIFIIVKDTKYVDSLADKLRENYRDKVSVVAFMQIARVVGSVTAAMDFITFTTSLSAFAVAIAGTAATMITSVVERTREIGVLKALGFTDGQVTMMIITESLIMGLVGLIVGISLGVSGAYFLASRGLVIRGIQTVTIVATPKITLDLVLKTVGITLLVGVIGGVFPAFRAAKIPPAVALRYE
jgi:putative ABC transport system permease protein